MAKHQDKFLFSKSVEIIVSSSWSISLPILLRYTDILVRFSKFRSFFDKLSVWNARMINIMDDRGKYNRELS
jgi:hypothetical protein